MEHVDHNLNIPKSLITDMLSIFWDSFCDKSLTNNPTGFPIGLGWEFKAHFTALSVFECVWRWSGNESIFYF